MRQPTPDEVRTELAERRLYRFVRQAWHCIEDRPFIDGWHIGAICEHLQAVTSGEIGKLLINVPPGCSKSLITCVFWPAWDWIGDPALREFTCSYDQSLSTRDAVKTRALIGSQWYQDRWGDRYQISRKQDEKTHFATDKGGYRLATSIGGHGTGEHPDRIIIDDPHKVKEAESETERRGVIEWWDLTMTMRGASRHAGRVIIMQRLHQGDLSGHVLDQGGWVHLCLPMRYEPDRMITTPLGFNDRRTVDGELLCPDQFNEEIVQEAEVRLGSYGSAGQLQQRPAPREGGWFKRDWFEIVDAVPAEARRRVRWWDLAATVDGDFTVGTKMSAVTHPGGTTYYVEDVRRIQGLPGTVKALVVQTAETDGKAVPIWMEQEPGSAGKTVIADFVQALAGYAFRGEVSSGSKEVRANPLASQAEVGNVKLVKGAWNAAWLDEFEIFNKGDYDDQVDSASGAFSKIAEPHIVPKIWFAGSTPDKDITDGEDE